MLRGTTLFYCSECCKRFIGADYEYACTTFSQPLKCPRCGSWHTRPWNPLPAKIANLRYKEIWKQIDNQKK